MPHYIKLLLGLILCTYLSTAIAQQNDVFNNNSLNDTPPAFVKDKLLSRHRGASPLANAKKYVRFIYLVPADSMEKPEYKLSIANAAKNLQRWYKEQLGNNKSFSLYEPIVEVHKSTHLSSWYSTNPDADWAGEWKFWFNVVNDAFSLSGGSFDDPDNFWVVYVDALPVCPFLQGGGLSHVAAMGANDLRGLVGKPWIPVCDEVIPDYSSCRYAGGLGHELGHAFGLPHPPGCDDGQSVACDYQSIMFLGYLDYPNTYFSVNEKAALNNSPFIGDVTTSTCEIDCSNLAINYDITRSVDVSICKGESYLAGGARQTVAGNYRDSFLSKRGCDSVVLTNLKILPVYNKIIPVSICRGQTYLAGGKLRTEPGTYSDTFKTRHGCDSIIVTVLKVNPIYNTVVEVAICIGNSYLAGGMQRTTAGTYTDNFHTNAGCDSVITTKLKVFESYQQQLSVSICKGAKYFAGGAWQTAQGTYIDKLKTRHGCDSIVTTKLTVLPTSTATVNASICKGDSYYAGGNLRTTAGVYSDTHKTKLGCDSVIVTRLSVVDSYQQIVNILICHDESYFAGGVLQHVDGTYTDKFKTKHGCDSTVITKLKVLPLYESINRVSICQGESYLAGGKLQYTSGDYLDKLKSLQGCDSLVTTQLKVLPTLNKSVDVVICPGEQYFAGAALQSKAGTYVDSFVSRLGCDSTITTHLSLFQAEESIVEKSICDGETYFAGGELQVKPGVYYDSLKSLNGCDSVVITKLTAGICTAVSEIIENSIKTYPIPTNKIINVEADNIHHIELFSALGQSLLSTNGGSIDLSPFPSGYYYLRIYSSPDKFVSRKIILHPD